MTTNVLVRADAQMSPTFADTVASELLKLRTGRAPKRNVIVGAIVGCGLAALVALATRLTWSDWSAADRADYEPVTAALVGGIVTAIFFAVVGVGVVATEYASGMIRLTFTVTPRRARVVAAKAVAVAVTTAVVAAFATVGMLLAVNAVLAGSDVPRASFTSGDVSATVVRTALVAPVFPVIAVAIAFLLRSVAAALTAVLALTFAPTVLGGLLPEWWRRNVLSLLPGPATDTLAMGHLAESELDRHPAVAALLVAGWVALFLGMAVARVTRADADG